MMKVTGIYDRHHRASLAALKKTEPEKESSADLLRANRARAIEVEERTFQELKGNVAPFVALYSAGPGQPQNDFFATADQALFAANGGPVNSWIAPGGGNLSERIVQEKDSAKAAQLLYLSVFSRPPTALESADVARALAVDAKARPAAATGLVWGLVTSAEFRFNH
jgi:hypothetical protein